MVMEVVLVPLLPLTSWQMLQLPWVPIDQIRTFSGLLSSKLWINNGQMKYNP